MSFDISLHTRFKSVQSQTLVPLGSPYWQLQDPRSGIRSFFRRGVVRSKPHCQPQGSRKIIRLSCYFTGESMLDFGACWNLVENGGTWWLRPKSKCAMFHLVPKNCEAQQAHQLKITLTVDKLQCFRVTCWLGANGRKQSRTAKKWPQACLRRCTFYDLWVCLETRPPESLMVPFSRDLLIFSVGLWFWDIPLYVYQWVCGSIVKALISCWPCACGRTGRSQTTATNSLRFACVSKRPKRP